MRVWGKCVRERKEKNKRYCSILNYTTNSSKVKSRGEYLKVHIHVTVCRGRMYRNGTLNKINGG